MGYHELPLSPHPKITIDGTVYDVDYFGMDDSWNAGEPAGSAFRFLFQLGSGYMIYLYVIQAAATAQPVWFFHTFWTKDCAVAEVEMEEHGAPSEVRADAMELPRLYGLVTITGELFQIVKQTFSAAPEQRMEIELDRGRLVWTRSTSWSLVVGDAPPRALGAGDSLRFE